jgi:hypothetical protein
MTNQPSVHFFIDAAILNEIIQAPDKSEKKKPRFRGNLLLLTGLNKYFSKRLSFFRFFELRQVMDLFFFVGSAVRTENIMEPQRRFAVVRYCP